MEGQQDYSKWSTEDLIHRVTSLEEQLKEQTQKAKSSSSFRKPRNAAIGREIDRSKYSTRFIALKFAYLGQQYNGLEYHRNNDTPIPTVEEELWKALNKAKLVFPAPNPLLEAGEPNWDGCDYSKCGRTDRGVSAFGQVIGIRVRSNLPVHNREGINSQCCGSIEENWNEAVQSKEDGTRASLQSRDEKEPSAPPPPSPPSTKHVRPSDPTKDEIPYCQILNRLLPPDIRILAWCPNPPPNFSARFSCRERQYKYFFTQPAFTPTPTSPSHPSKSSENTIKDGYLDIPAMRTAAQHLIGLHDFRNFCKLDPSKQIENFMRRITHASIDVVPSHLSYLSHPGFSSRFATPPHATAPPSQPTLYAFTLHGTAFLWHQVRHIVAILFLIGQGLEPPSLIPSLLDVDSNPCKPQYEMADDAPLVLWDCKFPDETGEKEILEWIHVGENGEKGRYGLGGVVDEMWKVWRGRKMDEVLAGQLLDRIVSQGGQSTPANDCEEEVTESRRRSQRVFQGGDAARAVGKYVPVLQKPRMESVEAINAKYAKRKGFESSQKLREQGFRRLDTKQDDSGGE
ncbi:pseudouridine synthase deg1 [Lecanora helva]